MIDRGVAEKLERHGRNDGGERDQSRQEDRVFSQVQSRCFSTFSRSGADPEYAGRADLRGISCAGANQPDHFTYVSKRGKSLAGGQDRTHASRPDRQKAKKKNIPKKKKRNLREEQIAGVSDSSGTVMQELLHYR